VNAISTGSIRFDRVLGGPGVPGGIVAEVFGEPDAGKTLFALQLVRSVQANSPEGALFIDVEHALDPGFAKRIGIDPSSLMFSQPDSAEEALDIADEIARSGAVELIVIDSAAALVPGAERDGRLRDDSDGRQARLLAQSLRTLSPVLERTGAVLLFTNQLRTRVGASFGPDETTPGGNALKFYTSLRIRLDPVTPIERNGERVGMRTRGSVVKNREAPPNRELQVDLMYDRGICSSGDLLDAGLEEGVIERTPDGWTFDDRMLGTSRSSARKRLKNTKPLREQLRKTVEEAYGARSNEH